MLRKLILSLCLILSITGILAVSPGFFKDPAVSPDGNQICFVYRDDLWIVPFRGGDARRLTNTDASEWSPMWSPDGSRIAYNSNREGQSYIYTISPSGGASTVLYRESLALVDWFADGNSLLCTRYNFRFGSSFVKLPLSGERPTLIAEIGDRYASLSPDNTKIIFNRYGDPFREAYQGSLNGDLWQLDIATKQYTRLTNTPGTERYPTYSHASNTLFYCASDGARFQIHRTENLNFARSTKLTNFEQWSARDIKIARQNDRLVYELFNEIWSYDPTRLLGAKVSRVEINIPEDSWSDTARRTTMTNEFGEYAVSDDELLVAYQYMYDVFAMPRKGGESRQVTADLGGVSNMLFLNDNRTLLMQRLKQGQDKLFKTRIDSTMALQPVDWFGQDSLFVESLYRDQSGLIMVHYRDQMKGGNVAYTDDSLSTFTRIPTPWVISSNVAFNAQKTHAAFAVVRDDTWMREFYIYSAMDSTLTKVFTDDQWISSIKWTPDNRSILMSRAGNIHRLDLIPRDEYEYDKDNWKEIFTTELSEEPIAAADSTADSLAIDIDEPVESTEEPAEIAPAVQIVWDNIDKRLFPVVADPSSYLSVVKCLSDSTFLYISEAQEAGGSSSLIKINIYGKNQEQEFSFGRNTGRFKEVGDFIYYLQESVLKAYNPKTSQRRELSASLTYDYDIKTLNRRVFEQVWGAFGLNFYDANMHGQDWDKLFSIYEPYLEQVQSVSDLETIIDEMIGDVNASHTGFYPRPENRYPGKAVAYLGMELDYSDRLSEGIRIKTVYPGTRLHYLYNIAPGAILREINGKLITANTPIDSLLLEQTGKTLRLGIRRETGDIEAVINGLSWSQMRSLHYNYKTEQSKQLVKELSNSRIGYVHIPAMGNVDFTNFTRDLFRDNSDKEALIIDVRGNVGGRIHDMIISLLIKKPYAYSSSRRYSRESRLEPTRIWNKPVAVLVDEHSFSDGEIFPIIFQELKLGKVIGFPSSGAVIGTWEYDLIDGSSMRMPSSGWYKLDKTNMEGTGAQPDIVVELTPNDLIEGNDKQIQRAVQELLDELNQ